MARKPYSSPRREADAAATRSRVIEAAGTLFVRDGYGATSMRAIAAEAGVSVQTVNGYGPKHAILLAVYEHALTQSEGWSTLNDAEPMKSIIGETDIEKMLDLYSRFMTGANERIAEIVRMVRAAADADSPVREVYAAIEERRHRSIREGIGLLAQRGVIAPDAAEDATAILTMLVSQDTYLQLRDAGWSADRYRDWLRGELSRLRA